MTEFYDMAVFPARARHPKDKALVENAVKLMYRSVYADIEGLVFHDLASLNAAIRNSLDAGTGKSFLATAIGYHACKNGIRTLYSNTSKLLSSLKVAKVKNTIETELKKIERCQLLILDDAFLVPLDAKERPILLEIIEDRHDRKSIVMASQLPVENWYDAIGDQAVADAVLDRIVHSSHRIELFGESIRKMKAKK